MKDTKPHNQKPVDTKDNTSSVCSDVLRRIESNQIQPRSRLFFQTRECVVWTFWFISVLLGALAVAVTLYVSLSVPHTLYEATHRNLLTALVSALPYLWFLVFFATGYLAIVNLRYTNRGYRYKTVTLLGSSVVISFLLGAVLQAVGHGYNLDRVLGEWIEFYPSYEKQKYAMWQEPEEGRMIGTIMVLDTATSTDGTDESLLFSDVTENMWHIDTSELRDSDIEVLLASDLEPVRLMGTTTSEGVFRVCGVFSWSAGKVMGREQLGKNRELFVDTVRTHHQFSETATEPIEITTDETEAVLEGEHPEDVAKEGTIERMCADIAMIQRADYLLAP